MRYLYPIRHWPFTTWALFAYALRHLISFLGLSYDGGLEGVVVITMGLWAIMFHLPGEYLYQLDITRNEHEILSTLIGFSLVIFLDVLIRIYRKSKKKR